MHISSKLNWIGCACLIACFLGGGLAHAETKERLISLAPHLTELTFAAGADDALVGVVAYSNYPVEAQQLPQIGDAFRFDMEAIVSLQPTIALAWRGGTPAVVAEQLQSLGIEVVWITTDSFQDIAEALRLIGRVAGDESVAEQAAADFLATIARFEADQDQTLNEEPVAIFYQISDRPLYTFGGRHVINEVFEICGGENIFATLDTEALSVDREAVLLRQPDLIIAGLPEPSDSADHDPLSQWIPHQQGALSDTQFHRVDPNLLVRPTARIVEGIETLCALTQSISQPSTP